MIWLGDFNYRIDLPNETCRYHIEKNNLETLLSSDQVILGLILQLRQAMKSKQAFLGLLEGSIKFFPTYKYDNGTNVYDSSEKMRVPSWTDRILFKGSAIQQIIYDRVELLLSDHRPVRSLFDLKVNVINKEIRSKLQRELYDQFIKQNCGSVSTPPPVPPRKQMPPKTTPSLVDLEFTDSSNSSVAKSSVSLNIEKDLMDLSFGP